MERAMAVRRPPRVDTRLPARGARSRHRTAFPALVLGLAALAACGPSQPEVVDLPETWPLTFEVPAILGYAAGVAGGRLEQVLGELGWDARGLDPSRPEVLMLLDPTVLGAPVALVLPVTDGEALVDSLDASELVEPLGGDRHRVTLPADHPLRSAARILRGGGSIRSFGDVVALLDDAGPLSVTLTVDQTDDWVLLVPSFEATLVARQALSRLPLQRTGPGRLAAAVDIERVLDTYHEEFVALEQQLTALLTGAPAAGLAGLLSAGMGRAGGGSSLPVSGDFLWTCWRLFAADEVVAVGFEAEGLPPLGRAEATSASTGPTDVTLRVRRRGASAYTDVTSSYRPAPAPVEGLAWRADPEAFRVAVTTLLVPLAEYVKGEGAPARRWLETLDRLLAPWSGRVAVEVVGDGAVLVVGQRPGERFDGDGWMAWTDALLDAAGADPGLGPLSLFEEGDATRLPHDEALVWFAGDVDPDDLELAIARTLAAEAPADGPFLRLRGPGVEAAASGDGVELLVELRVDRTVELLDLR